MLSFPHFASPWSLHLRSSFARRPCCGKTSFSPSRVLHLCWIQETGGKGYAQPQVVSHKVTSQGRVSRVLNIFSSLSEEKSLGKGQSRGSSGVPESLSNSVMNKFKLNARASYCLITCFFLCNTIEPFYASMPLFFCDLCGRNLSFHVACINRNIKMA